MMPCPGDETLRRAVRGTDTVSFVGSDAALDGHLEGCPRCRDRLEGLARPTDPGSGSGSDEGWEPPAIDGFEAVRRIGRGGMGVVILAREVALGRPVAIKFLPGGPASGRSNRALREARAAAGGRHANVVEVYRVGEAAGCPFVVMEYVEGGSLADRLRGGPLAPREAAALVETIARAVAHVHARGYVHRDLKPANILLDGEPGAPIGRMTPKVADFGLALALDDPDATDSRAGMGTLHYMAPEQAGCGPVGPTADVYSLGAILYHALAGRPPLEGSSPAATLAQVLHREPAPPRKHRPDLPRDLEAIALKCLEKRPARRYGSTGALADDLRRFLDRRPVLARRRGPLLRAARWCRREPAVAALLLGLAVSLAGALGLARQAARDAQSAEAAQADSEKAREATERAHAESLAAERRYRDMVVLATQFPADLVGRHSVNRRPSVARDIEQTERAIAFQRVLLERCPDDPDVRRNIRSNMARLLSRLGTLRWYDGRMIPVAEFNQSHAEWTALAQEDPDAIEPLRELVAATLGLGSALQRTSDSGRLYGLYEDARRRLASLPERTGDFTDIRLHLEIHIEFFIISRKLGIPRRASELDTLWLRLLSLAEGLPEDDPGRPEIGRLAHELCRAYPSSPHQTPILEKAAVWLESGIAPAELALGEHPDDHGRFLELATLHRRLGELSHDLGKSEAAEKHRIRLTQLCESAVRLEPEWAWPRSMLAWVETQSELDRTGLVDTHDALRSGRTAEEVAWLLFRHARLAREEGRIDDCDATIELVRSAAERLATERPEDPGPRLLLAETWTQTAKNRIREANPTAIDAARRAADCLRGCLAARPETIGELDIALDRLARFAVELGRFEEAATALLGREQLLPLQDRRREIMAEVYSRHAEAVLVTSGEIDGPAIAFRVTCAERAARLIGSAGPTLVAGPEAASSPTYSSSASWQSSPAHP